MIVEEQGEQPLFEVRDKDDDFQEEESWLVVTPWEGYAADVPGTLGSDEVTSSGKFIRYCGDTCYMWMSLDKDKAYKVIVRTDPGTVVAINEIVYTLEM